MKSKEIKFEDVFNEQKTLKLKELIDAAKKRMLEFKKNGHEQDPILSERDKKMMIEFRKRNNGKK